MPMTPRRYNAVWRILAAAISLAALVLLWQSLRGEVRAPDWAAAAGIVLVLVFLPFMAFTGRAAAWLERMMRSDA